MEFLLFLILAIVVFGSGFVIAGLHIAFLLALFTGLMFGGTAVAVMVVGLSLSPLLFFAALFYLAWWLGRNSRQRETASAAKELKN